MVANLVISKISLDDLFLHLLPSATQKAFLKCSKLSLFQNSDWYLAGGTALALQVGHRQSVDLDFFTAKTEFPTQRLERKLIIAGNWKTTFGERGTLYGIFMKAKMSFISYPFFRPAHPMIKCGYVNILSVEDIAAMKIIAISQRGRKRDFLDLYWYCQNMEPLEKIVSRSVKQFPGQEDNLPHIMKSLVYFTDADSDPMPKLFFKTTWPEVKRYFLKEVPAVTRKLLKL